MLTTEPLVFREKKQNEMRKALLLKWLILCLICSSCRQKSTNEQEKIQHDTLEHRPESQERINKIDETKRVRIKEENAAIENYICYTSDTNTSQKMWIGFNNADKATEIRYKGQSESIALKFVSSAYIEGGTQPTIIDYYDEIYKGKRNGRYQLTKSGNWYYVAYKRAKDDKEFNFTIDHTVNNRTATPCF